MLMRGFMSSTPNEQLTKGAKTMKEATRICVVGKW